MQTHEWEALLDGTTPGPWETHPELSKAIVNLDMKFGVLMVLDEGSPGPENGRLAAAAPAAVAEVIRLRRAMEAVRDDYRRSADPDRWPPQISTVPLVPAFNEVADVLTRILEGDSNE